MKHLVDFCLVGEATAKDDTGQTIKTNEPTSTNLVGELKSVYQNEFYKAEQAGIRPQGVIEMSSFDYCGQSRLSIGSADYVIYRTYNVGTDRIELYFGDRVGGNDG